MSLYDPDRRPDVAPEDAVLVVHAFVRRCAAWAESREIPKRTERLRASGDPADAASLHAWVAYRSFLAHTLAELEDGTLDDWFTAPDAP